MRPLSISASEPVQPNLKDLIRTLIAVGMLILIVNYIGGLIIPRLTEQPPAILPSSSSAGVAALWRLSQTISSLIAFTGSSEMQAAGSPATFDQQVKALSNNTVYSANVSVVGASTKTVRDLLKNLIIPHGVKTVFYGVELRAFHQQFDNVWLEPYHASPLGYALSLPSGNEQSLLLWLIEHSSLIRYRTNLRRWLSGQFAQEDPFALMDQLGHWITNGIRNRDRKTIDEQFASFQKEADYYQAFGDVLSMCGQPEMHCYIINMPLHNDANQYIPVQKAQAYKTMLYDAMHTAGFTLWDFNTEACFNYFGDTSFYDLNHLNTEGAVKFTQRLALIYLDKLDQDNIACPEVIKP